MAYVTVFHDVRTRSGFVRIQCFLINVAVAAVIDEPIFGGRDLCAATMLFVAD